MAFNRTDTELRGVGVLVGIGMLLAVVLGSPVLAGETVVDYRFQMPTVQSVSIGGTMYDRVQMPGISNSGNIGEPSLPARGAKVLLPFGATVEDVEVITGRPILVGDGYFIEPVAQPHRLSDPSAAPLPRPDKAIYESSDPYPTVRFESAGVQSFRGFDMLIVKLNPVEYNPVSGELWYYPDLQVRVRTSDNVKVNSLYRGFENDQFLLERKVDNPQDVVSYVSQGRLKSRAYDMLIITTADLAASFQPLKDYHDTTGTATEIHTIGDIGSNDPTAVRDYIRERYYDDGIDFVLIGADDDLIPAVDLYVKSWEGEGASIEASMPADIYFSCLDGGYNSDGDDKWGEPNDGDAGDVDLIGEVYVGRAAVGSTEEADRFVSKTLTYLGSDSPYLDRVLMCGEHLGFGGESEYAGNTMDEHIDGSSNDGYTTVGIPSQKYSISKLYDRDWVNNSWPVSEIYNRINDGLHIINHLGHGSTFYAVKMTQTTIYNHVNNSDHFFLYSQACLSGHFDNADCWAEVMTIKQDYGAFAVIMNARYGWGSHGSTDGPSQRFNRPFWDAQFDETEGMVTLAQANQDSKEDNIYRINESCMRWCAYELTLFGDPAIVLKGVRDCASDNLPDVDGDEYCDAFDNCPDVANGMQEDADGDNVGDACDVCPSDPDNDMDGDGLCSDVDNCPGVANVDQTDTDGDGVGDLCDICEGYDDNVDTDEDGFPDGCDNCPEVPNVGQYDNDDDGIGNDCDNCRSDYNPGQEDADGDNVGDVCEMCPGFDDMEQSDTDGLPDSCDNCPQHYNPDQADVDGDGPGDVCDNCPIHYNPDQWDADGDDVGEICDVHCGDVNGDLTGPNVVDLTHLVSYLFNGGPPPADMDKADMNGVPGQVNILDLTCLVAYLFDNGPAPVCP